MELQDVVNDPDLAEEFTIVRSTGSFASGGWQDTKTEISAYGIVTVADDNSLEAVPEADRIHGARIFIAECPIYVTSEDRRDGTTGTSDVLVWQGQKYRVQRVGNYSNRGGFYYAVATRTKGA
jgi:hypothetical protein